MQQATAKFPETLKRQEKMHWMPFLLGLLLPLITVTRDFGGASTDVADRVIAADLILLLFLLGVFLARQLFIDSSLKLYIAVLILASFIGLCETAAGSQMEKTAAGTLALTMAFLYYVGGFSIGRSPDSLRSFALGVAAGVCWEFVIVFHDYFSSTPWFFDSMENRVRGTFKKSGQLACYSLAAGCLLLLLSVKPGNSPRFRRFLRIVSFCAMFMIVASCRRSAILSVALGVCAFFVASVIQGNFKALVPLVIVLAAGIWSLVGNMDVVDDSFLGKRLFRATESMADGESWTHIEFEGAIRYVDQWFPFGVGPGQSFLFGVDHHEIHNGHLGLLVDMGLLGSFAFYWLAFGQLVMGSRNLAHKDWLNWKTFLLGITIACFAFMGHNRLFRDRTFLIFVGVVSSIQMSAMRQGRNIRKTPAIPRSRPPLQKRAA